MATLEWTTDADDQGLSVGADQAKDFSDHQLDSDFFNNVFFFFNIFSYLVFCTYLALFAFDTGEFTPTRDFCVEGAYVELFYATKLG